MTVVPFPSSRVGRSKWRDQAATVIILPVVRVERFFERLEGWSAFAPVECIEHPIVDPPFFFSLGQSNGDLVYWSTASDPTSWSPPC